MQKVHLMMAVMRRAPQILERAERHGIPKDRALKWLATELWENRDLFRPVQPPRAGLSEKALAENAPLLDQLTRKVADTMAATGKSVQSSAAAISEHLEKRLSDATPPTSSTPPALATPFQRLKQILTPPSTKPTPETPPPHPTRHGLINTTILLPLGTLALATLGALTLARPRR